MILERRILGRDLIKKDFMAKKYNKVSFFRILNGKVKELPQHVVYSFIADRYLAGKPIYGHRVGNLFVLNDKNQEWHEVIPMLMFVAPIEIKWDHRLIYMIFDQLDRDGKGFCELYYDSGGQYYTTPVGTPGVFSKKVHLDSIKRFQGNRVWI